MENSYIVNGGIPLKGEVVLSGSKNVALKVIIASLLFKGEVVLENIPHIKDIEELINLINILGGKAQFLDSNRILIDGTNLKNHKIDLLYGSKIRVSFMLFAPLLYKLNLAEIPNPGGCRIGARSIDRSIDFMKALGTDVIYEEETGYFKAKLNSSLKGTKYKFIKPSHTGCEFAILMSVFATGETIIENASLEPEIDELINFLNDSGAKIKRINQSIIIDGVTELVQKKPFKISYDRNEAVTYAIFGISTKGDVIVHGSYEKDLVYFLKKLSEIDAGFQILDEQKIRFFYKKIFNPTNITTIPHPGFMTDWQAPWAVLMTQANGISTIHETIFENRFGYVDELKKIGAEMEFFQPKVDDPKSFYQFNSFENKDLSKLNQAIRIFGKTNLHSGVMNVSDLRAGASLLIGATIAEGESVINGASVIERGYEEIDKKLSLLGASIKKI